MKDFLLVIAALAGIAMVIYFIVLFVKDYHDRQRQAKQSLIDQIEQYQNIIRENEAKAEEKVQKYERDRIRRDINLALGHTNDKLVDIIIEYCPCKLMSAKSFSEMRAQIKESIDNCNFDNLLKEKYLPIIGKADFYLYQYELQQLKPIILLHKDLMPQDVIEQIDFYRQNNHCNINDLELSSCVKPIKLYLKPYDEFSFFMDNEVEKIVNLIVEHFELGYVDFEDVLDHSSYHRSIFGIQKIFAKSLFYSGEVYSHLSCLDEDIFVDIIEEYFFYEVCYDIKKFRDFLSEIISHVKEKRVKQTIF